MKSTLIGTGLALACAVTLGAQSTSPTQSYPSSDSPKKMSSDKAKDKKSVTLSGCLREGDAPGEFVLANVDMSQMKGMKGHDTTSTTTPSATSGSGSATTGAAGGMDNRITLVSAANVNLKEHVGHQVEVTGTMAGMDKMKDKSRTPTGTTGSAAGETTSDTTSRTGSGERGMKSDKDHKLTVRALKHVSATCTP